MICSKQQTARAQDSTENDLDACADTRANMQLLLYVEGKWPSNRKRSAFSHLAECKWDELTAVSRRRSNHDIARWGRYRYKLESRTWPDKAKVAHVSREDRKKYFAWPLSAEQKRLTFHPQSLLWERCNGMCHRCFFQPTHCKCEQPPPPIPPPFRS